MDVNAFLSLTTMLSGLYSCLCFFPKTGKVLFPSLYDDGGGALQRYSMLIVGAFIGLAGAYGVWVEPIFN
jgi:hypothetical protein